ncbi:MAG: HAD hydrolase-like protein [Thermoanaerobacteraceae bacterium]|nr:HAD hydrolase-like protein [Thermoanaerobacteraceae bacterium]
MDWPSHRGHCAAFCREKGGRVYQRYQHHYHRDHDRYTRHFPGGTLEMLHNLRTKGIQLGIVTSKRENGCVADCALPAWTATLM